MTKGTKLDPPRTLGAGLNRGTGSWELEKVLEGGYQTWRDGMKSMGKEKTDLGSNSKMNLRYMKI